MYMLLTHYQVTLQNLDPAFFRGNVLHGALKIRCNLKTHKMFRRRSGHRLNVLHTFNLRSVSRGHGCINFFISVR